MQIRSLLWAAVVGAALPLAALAQSNPLQSAFEGLGDNGKRAAQEQLQASGFYSGPVDGQYGRGTEGALTRGAEFIYANTQPRIRFDLSSAEGAQRYVQALARGELIKHLLGEGEGIID